MSSFVRRIMLGLVGVFLVACLAVMSFEGRECHNPVSDGEIGNVDDRTAIARSLFRRGMIDAASHRFERAGRAFDAARRAARDDAEFRERIDAEAAKLEPLSRKGDVK